MARPELKVRAAARQDMIQLRQYGFREFGREAADRLVDDLEKVFQLLLDYPLAGRVFSSDLPGIRVYSKRGHRIFYRAEEGTVAIVRVLHHSRDVARHLKQ